MPSVFERAWRPRSAANAIVTFWGSLPYRNFWGGTATTDSPVLVAAQRRNHRSEPISARIAIVTFFEILFIVTFGGNAESKMSQPVKRVSESLPAYRNFSGELLRTRAYACEVG